ncbi:MAG: hypothetical protein WA364_27825 [Candidatus Nitrosopolaris sp.]
MSSDDKVLGTIDVINDGKVATTSQIQIWTNTAKIQCDRDVLPDMGLDFRLGT